MLSSGDRIITFAWWETKANDDDDDSDRSKQRTNGKKKNKNKRNDRNCIFEWMLNETEKENKIRDTETDAK